MNARRLMLLLACAALFSGCTTFEPVRPWEKGLLAKPEMNFARDRLEQSFDEHIYASREGAAGGNGASGGGCGCY